MGKEEFWKNKSLQLDRAIDRLINKYNQFYSKDILLERFKKSLEK